MKQLSTERPVKLPTARTFSGNFHAIQALLVADQRPGAEVLMVGLVGARRVESENPRLQSIRRRRGEKLVGGVGGRLFEAAVGRDVR